VAHNIANSHTPGFKRLQHIQSDMSVGGVQTVSVHVDHRQGPVEMSDSPIAMAIAGQGFFKLHSEKGDEFTRLGQFQIGDDRYLETSDYYRLEPEIRIPEQATSFNVHDNGIVSYADSEGLTHVAGQLELSTFADPSKLKNMGSNRFTETADSGSPISGVPGHNSLGKIAFGFLEGSNVDIGDEMIDLLLAKVGVLANKAVLDVEDDMAGDIVNITV